MKNIVKNILRENSLSFKFSKYLYNQTQQYYKVSSLSINHKINTLFLAIENRWIPKPWVIDTVRAYALYKFKISFIQIGSNNGVTGDPLFEYIRGGNWQGVLVEPVPYLYEELKNNYRDFDDRLKFENSAIGKVNGQLKFYRLKKSELPDLPKWYDQLGSFNKEVVLTHRNCIPHFFDLFIEDNVTAITFDNLLVKHSIKELNFLHIDTEGYDFEILKMIDFQQLHIEFVMFEHKHLSKSDYKEAVTLFKKNGYKVGTNGGADTIAIKKNILKKLISSTKF